MLPADSRFYLFTLNFLFYWFVNLFIVLIFVCVMKLNYWLNVTFNSYHMRVFSYCSRWICQNKYSLCEWIQWQYSVIGNRLNIICVELASIIVAEICASFDVHAKSIISIWYVLIASIELVAPFAIKHKIFLATNLGFWMLHLFILKLRFKSLNILSIELFAWDIFCKRINKFQCFTCFTF